MAVTVFPRSVTVAECSVLTLTSLVTRGSRPYGYQWLKDGVAIPGANDPTLTTSNLFSPGAIYSLAVTNLFSSARDSAVVSIAAAPVHVLSAKLNCVTLNTVTVVLDSTLNAASANDPSRYSISGGVPSAVVLGAALQLDSKTVFLTTSPMSPASCYTLTVKDCTGRADTPTPIRGPALATLNYKGQATVVVEAEDYDGNNSPQSGTSWTLSR